MNVPSISVITVCYNAAEGLKKTIGSVAQQDYPNLEYIVIDGNSSDNTIEILKRKDTIISKWISEPDKGIYDAMNKGIRHATGEWLIFMNAGDIFSGPRTLSQMASYLDDNISILRGNIIRVYEHFKVKSCGVTEQSPGIMDMMHNTFHHQACLIRRLLFDYIGLYDTGYRLCADWKFFFDCVILNRVKSRYVNVTVALFRMDGASSANTKQCIDEHRNYLHKVYGEELYSLLEELAQYRKSRICRICFSFRKNLIERLSPTVFNRILNFKRICYSLLGLRVN